MAPLIYSDSTTEGVFALVDSSSTSHLHAAKPARRKIVIVGLGMVAISFM